MPLVPGFSPNIREAPAVAVDPIDTGDTDIIVVDAEDGADIPEFDDAGNVIRIKHANGDITISLDGRPLQRAGSDKPGGWFDNLVYQIDQMELGRISNDLLTGIEDDLTSRQEWVEARTQGLKLLGIKIEIPGVGGAADGAPVDGISQVRHPLLLEAVLRFQANARSELLPTDGPVKIRNDNINSQIENDQLANSLESDLNHYLTAVAKEYYPDTDRMLFMLGFGGTSFKKVYFCPLRNRPVSESIDADDLIVNNSATDLSNAQRVTHRSYMKQSTVKRLQILGVYSNDELGTPMPANLDSVQMEKKNQQGISPDDYKPNDRPREIYECYCELDIKGFEHTVDGEISGLEIPYRVTIDKSSQKILSIVRNYDEESKELPEALETFVKYTFVPGLGFYDLGLLHLLGNTTNAVTAAWRELLDAGMFASFPGFLYAKQAGRQNTNIFRVPPGGGAPVDTNGMAIQDFVMPLPYKDPSPALMQLVDNMAQTGQRIGGTSEQMVGEGKQDAPVGTTLALIDQATKVLNSVHKRMHAAQATEFQLLKRVFKDHPDSFWKRNRKLAYPWDEETFIKALDDFDLVPQADPNTASATMRFMKIQALKALQAANPSMYDPIAIDTAAIQAIGYSNPEQFFVPMSAMGKPPPELQKEQAETQAKVTTAAARASLDAAKAKEIIANIGKPEKGEAAQQQPTNVDLITAQAKMLDSQTKARQVQAQFQEDRMESAARAADRRSQENIAALEFKKDHLSDLMDLAKEQLSAHADVVKTQVEHAHAQKIATVKAKQLRGNKSDKAP